MFDVAALPQTKCTLSHILRTHPVSGTSLANVYKVLLLAYLHNRRTLRIFLSSLLLQFSVFLLFIVFFFYLFLLLFLHFTRIQCYQHFTFGFLVFAFIQQSFSVSGYLTQFLCVLLLPLRQSKWLSLVFYSPEKSRFFVLAAVLWRVKWRCG